jgi:hypothetical protein
MELGADKLWALSYCWWFGSHAQKDDTTMIATSNRI